MLKEVTPIVLTGRAARLEPTTEAHLPALWEATTPEIFAYIGYPPNITFDSFASHLKGLIIRPNSLLFSIISQGADTPIGVTSYMDIQPRNGGLEIGSTWLASAYHGTAINPECKYLLLRHAFETLGAIRVQLKTDARNEQSQRAIAKLGAQREGVLRKHVILLNGYIRDTVMFSILSDEWPTVKTGLETRLGYTL